MGHGLIWAWREHPDLGPPPGRGRRGCVGRRATRGAGWCGKRRHGRTGVDPDAGRPAIRSGHGDKGVDGHRGHHMPLARLLRGRRLRQYLRRYQLLPARGRDLLGGAWKLVTAVQLPTNAQTGPDEYAYWIGVSCAAPASCTMVGGYEDTTTNTFALIGTLSGTTLTASQAPEPKGAAPA